MAAPPQDIEWEDGTVGAELPPEDVEWDEAPPEPASPLARLRAAAKGPARDPGLMRTIGSALLQGFTKGGSDEAAGGIGALATGTPLPGATWRETGEALKTQGDVYRAGRNSEREVLRGARENRPKTAMALELLGDFGSDMVAGGLGLNPSSPGYGVLAGGLSGLLGSDAELTPDKATAGDVASAGGSTALGAGLGLLLPFGGRQLAKLAPAALRALRGKADDVAVSQGTRVLLNGADQLARVRPPRPEAVLEAIDSRAIRPFSTTKATFERLERQAEDKGAAYGAILEELEKAGVRGPQAEALALELSEEGKRLVGRTAADKSVPQVYLDEAANIRSPDVLEAAPPGAPGTLGLGQAEDIKRALQTRAKYGELKDTPVNDARMDVASRLRQAIEEGVEGAGAAAPEGSDLRQLAESFVPVKQSLGKTLEARNAAEKGAAAAAKRSKISLTDYLAGASGGWGLAALNNFARNRGTSAVASGARGVARLARAGANRTAANPEATQRGGAELGALLGRQFSPRLAELLGLGAEPQDETQAALIEALRRQEQ